MTAHSGDATTLDWHPTRPNIVATGGANDRSVKIWDLETSLSLSKDDAYMNGNSNTVSSKGESVGTEDSSETDRSQYVLTNKYVWSYYSLMII
jgi:WD40 repeat protein